MADKKDAFSKINTIVDKAMGLVDSAMDMVSDVFAEPVPETVVTMTTVRISLTDSNVADILRGKTIAFKAHDINIRLEKE